MSELPSQSLTELFKLTSSTRLDRDLLVKILRAIDVRLQPLERQKSDLDVLADQLEGVVLARVNDVLTPGIQSILTIQQRGFLIANSETQNTLGVDGVLTFVVGDADQRANFTPSPFVAVTREATPDDYAIARTVSYDNATGEFVCQIVTVAGDPGPHADWVIGGMSGATLATIAHFEATKAARDQVLGAQEQAEEDADRAEAAAAGTSEAAAQAHVWAFAAETADADPGDGLVRLNHATAASVTAIYVDNLVAGGGDASGWLDRFGASTTTGDRGTVTLRQVDDASKWATFQVTAGVTDGTGYRKLTVSHLAGPGGFVAGKQLVFGFSRSGNRGLDGAGTGDVFGPAGATDGNIPVLDATGKVLTDSGVSPASIAASISGHTHGTSGLDDGAVTFAKVAAAAKADAAAVRAGTASKLVTAEATLAALDWVTIIDAATLAIDHKAGINRKVTLGGDRVVGAPTNAIPGAPLNIWIVQDGTGNRQPTWAAAYDFGDATPPILSAGAGQADVVMFMCLAAGKFAYMGIRKRVDG
ncbi:hypothetical protein [Oricola indica]|jgi:hypothetical protein|uniref:hypothetical protein n=1 Tax=Oricola indica TaxID=2872591 RepID=UPI001CBAD7A0|nr:hypothetical protein [Oricola indica]